MRERERASESERERGRERKREGGRHTLNRGRLDACACRVVIVVLLVAVVFTCKEVKREGGGRTSGRSTEALGGTDTSSSHGSRALGYV